MYYPKLNPLSKSTMERDNARKRALVVRRDIERINEALASATYEELIRLHKDLDGTYQGVIKNWGTSTYGYNKELGYVYSHLNESSIKENLDSMKGKLRGYMLQLDPDAENIQKHDNSNKENEGKNLSKRQNKLLNDYEQIKGFACGPRMLNIPEEQFPLFRDTLMYMQEYEYIRPLPIDGAPYCFVTEPAFKSFAMHIEAQEDDEDMVEERKYDNNKVFIVHGHDEMLLDEVEKMVYRIGLKPIILKNEASGGRTVIEKIEHYTDVGFGIVLYTACDEGRVKGSTSFNRRARQNVVFEHGYLCAKLSRSRVVALNDSGIEVPSDLAGVVYISHEASDWKNQIMREMREAGLEFDSTRA